MVDGSWLMAHGSWLMPQGSWPKAHGRHFGQPFQTELSDRVRKIIRIRAEDFIVEHIDNAAFAILWKGFCESFGQQGWRAQIHVQLTLPKGRFHARQPIRLEQGRIVDQAIERPDHDRVSHPSDLPVSTFTNSMAGLKAGK